jgi:hypothetical protein
MEFNLSIAYSTIAVFEPTLDHPFNDWTNKHIYQGFSWRKESVSFRTLRDYGIAKVQTVIANELKIAPDITRAILVPFEVASSGRVEITSIDRGEVIEIPSGSYALVYQARVLNAKEELCLMTFIPAIEPVEPHILRTDPLLSPEYPLLMEAQAA